MQTKNPSKAGLAVLFIVLLLALMTWGTGNSNQSYVVPEGTQQHNQSEIRNLQAEIPQGTEMYVADIWGPIETTYAYFHTMDDKHIYLALCQQVHRTRPLRGRENTHYFLSARDPTLLTTNEGILQDFRILEEIPASVFTATVPVSSTATSGVDTTGTSLAVQPGTSISPSNQSTVPVVWACWALGIVLVLVLIVVLVTRIRRWFSRG